MGFDLTTLKNLPDHFEVYFFLIGDYSNDALVNNFFRKNFSAIANRIGANAAIIRQTRKSNIEEELRLAISKCNFNNKKITLDSVLNRNQNPGLLILNKHPYKLTNMDKIFYIPFMALNFTYLNTEELLTDLTEFTNGDQQLLKKTESRISELRLGVKIGFISIDAKLKPGFRLINRKLLILVLLVLVGIVLLLRYL